MIRLLALAAASALALASCQQAESPAETADVTPPAVAIDPVAPVTPTAGNELTATGYGPLRIGMTRAEVVAALGEDADPDAVGGADPSQCDEFRPARAPEGTLVMIEDGRLTRISLIRTSTSKTDRGFGVGDQAAAIKTAYGEAARVTPHKYEAAPAEYITAWSSGAGAEPYVQNSEARGLVYEIGSAGTVQAVRAGGPSIQYVEGCA